MNSKRASIVTIREMCDDAIKQADLLLAEIKGKSNPQTLELYAQVQGRKQAFEAVLEATYANYFNLRTFTGER